MTEHQSLPVHGYVPQSDMTVALVNDNKMKEEMLLQHLDIMQRHPQVYDARWLAIARTHFEQGYMALNRAVFKPQRVVLPDDKS